MGGRTVAVTITALERARKYLAAIPGAVSGQGGHDQTFSAACALVNGFALSEADALAKITKTIRRGWRPGDKVANYLLRRSRRNSNSGGAA